mmetsp:Transcript_24390/g.46282  ORF Transcript_24390/g.46282 Transcript_24390/m.46282 type:complete len:296 (-) Transcript_24390:1278-2165(-)
MLGALGFTNWCRACADATATCSDAARWPYPELIRVGPGWTRSPDPSLPTPELPDPSLDCGCKFDDDRLGPESDASEPSDSPRAHFVGDASRLEPDPAAAAVSRSSSSSPGCRGQYSEFANFLRRCTNDLAWSISSSALTPARWMEWCGAEVFPGREVAEAVVAASQVCPTPRFNITCVAGSGTVCGREDSEYSEECFESSHWSAENRRAWRSATPPAEFLSLECVSYSSRVPCSDTPRARACTSTCSPGLSNRRGPTSPSRGGAVRKACPELSMDLLGIALSDAPTGRGCAPPAL